MNVLEDPNGLAELQKLGVRSVPVLSRGDKFTFGQSTKQIVDFLGLNEKSGPELSTDELAARVDKFMGAALELIPLMPARPARHPRAGPAAQLPHAGLPPVPRGRGLPRRQRGHHPGPGDVPRGARSPTPTPPTLVAYGEKVRKRFRDWWTKGDTVAHQAAADLLRPAEPARADGAHDLAFAASMCGNT